MCSQWSSKQRIRLNLPISAFYPHFSVLSPFQRFIPISAFYPHFSVLSPFQRFIPISAFYPHFSFRFQFPFPRFSFSVLSPFQRFIPISAFYPHFSVLSPFQRFIPISAFYPHFSVLSPFQRFIPISVSAFSFRFRDSVSAFYPYPRARLPDQECIHDVLQQFASKHKPQTFSRVCLRLKRDVYRWKRNVSLLM